MLQAVRRCVVCQSLIDPYRLWEHPRAITCKGVPNPGNCSKRHKQNLKNESARRLRKERKR